MTAVIQAILALVEQLLPLITSSGSSATIDSIINALIKILPFVAQEVEALVPPIKNIIAALSANPATTADQLAQLQSLDQSVDKAFEDAAVSTDAEGQTPTP